MADVAKIGRFVWYELLTHDTEGAKVMNGPMTVPDGTRIVQMTDPQGAWFALHAGVAKAS